MIGELTAYNLQSFHRASVPNSFQWHWSEHLARDYRPERGLTSLELIAMFDGLFQPAHLFVLLVLALFVFGPKRLPELGKAIGEGIRSFKSGIKDSSDQTGQF